MRLIESDNMLILDKKIDNYFLEELSKLDSYILTKENKDLDQRINSHPDMLIRKLEDRDIIVDRENYSYYKDLLKDFNIIKSSKKLESTYPNDIALNFLTFDKYFVHNLKYTDELVIDYFKKRSYEFIDVSQGYTKCSCLLGKNSLITSDLGIYNKVKDKISSLLIEHKHVKLSGFNYGFIGGASGLVDGKIIILGDLSKHPSHEKIIKFLDDNNENYKILNKKELSDYGSIFQI